MAVNIKYKDSVFSFLFSDPDTLRELYCALGGVTLPPDVPVIINTLQDVLFMDRINDISFEIGGKLVVLIEHQSTINPNMALKLLMYIARVYEKITRDKNIHSTTEIRLPRPEFFVLYNGKESQPDEKIMRLSELFENTADLGIFGEEAAALELVVKVININEGKNTGIVRKCETLAQYSAFVAKVREFQNDGHNLDEAVKRAITYCRNYDILKEFLEQHSTEVFNMLMKEFNFDEVMAVRYEDGIIKGRAEGKMQSSIDIARNALAKGIPLDMIHEITGLGIQTIEDIQANG